MSDPSENGFDLSLVIMGESDMTQEEKEIVREALDMLEQHARCGGRRCFQGLVRPDCSCDDNGEVSFPFLAGEPGHECPPKVPCPQCNGTGIHPKYARLLARLKAMV